MTSSLQRVNDRRVEIDQPGRARSRVLTRLGAGLAAAVVLAALVPLAAACSSSKNPASGRSGSSRNAGAMAQALAYAHCIRSHGISDFPDPGGSPGGIDFSVHGGPNSDLNPTNPQYQAAKQACQSLLPGGLAAPDQSAQKISEETKLATCMRSHGYPKFPDPNSQGAFDFSGIDRNAPAFQSALKTCEAASGFSGPFAVEQGSGGKR